MTIKLSSKDELVVTTDGRVVWIMRVLTAIGLLAMVVLLMLEAWRPAFIVAGVMATAYTHFWWLGIKWNQPGAYVAFGALHCNGELKKFELQSGASEDELRARFDNWCWARVQERPADIELTVTAGGDYSFRRRKGNVEIATARVVIIPATLSVPLDLPFAGAPSWGSPPSCTYRSITAFGGVRSPAPLSRALLPLEEH